MRARPAVLAAHRVVGAQLRLAAGVAPAERQVRGRRTLQVGRVARRELLGVDLGVIELREFLGEAGLSFHC